MPANSYLTDASLNSLPVGRRTMLQAGFTGALGLSLPQMLALNAVAARNGGAARAKNVLVVLEQGGMSHLDTWDPKPEMPAENRSIYKPVSTKIPGMQFTELLSKTGTHAEKLAVVRSMNHTKSGANGHPKGTQYALSGAHPSSPIEMPDMGSVIWKLLGTKCGYLPGYIMVPGNSEQAKESRVGFMPNSYSVFKCGGRDVSEPDWVVNDLLPRSENEDQRFSHRKQLLGELDGGFLNSREDVRNVEGMQSFYEQAFDTLTSNKVNAAFDHHAEPVSVREAYGKGHRGACYLVGRKLIEAGVRFVTVDVRWPLKPHLKGGTNLNCDHHDFIYAKGTCNLPGAGGGGRGRRGIGTWEMMGSVDQAFSALLGDLDQRGLLAETLVCFVTEFGRTPKINKHQGRDHWTNAYSIAFAGAGVPGGQIIGASDHEGGFVADSPYTPEDYASTIYKKLGLDLNKPIYTPSNRPIFFGHAGHPIDGLF